MPLGRSISFMIGEVCTLQPYNILCLTREPAPPSSSLMIPCAIGIHLGLIPSAASESLAREPHKSVIIVIHHAIDSKSRLWDSGTGRSVENRLSGNISFHIRLETT